jgi:hypothetical protein
MDKRFFLALVLTALVIVVTPLLFPAARRVAVEDHGHQRRPTRAEGVRRATRRHADRILGRS